MFSSLTTCPSFISSGYIVTYLITLLAVLTPLCLCTNHFYHPNVTHVRKYTRLSATLSCCKVGQGSGNKAILVMCIKYHIFIHPQVYNLQLQFSPGQWCWWWLLSGGVFLQYWGDHGRLLQSEELFHPVRRLSRLLQIYVPSSYV